MPNIGSLFREEITRLSRREARGQIEPAKKAIAQHRRDIAALKRQFSQLERQLKLLAGKAPSASSMAGCSMWANLGAHSGDRDAARQAASSQVMAKITGTESSVATKIVSRAKITPRS